MIIPPARRGWIPAGAGMSGISAAPPPASFPQAPSYIRVTVAPECATRLVQATPPRSTRGRGAQDCCSMDADATRSQLVAALVRVAGGDRAALRIVYQDTSAKLFGVCLRILKDRGEAEDVLQDVYVTVWRKADSFDPGRASPITWMVAIARNRSIDRLRSRAAGGRFEPIEAADVVSDPAPA